MVPQTFIALWWLFDVEVFEVLFIECLQANGPLRTIAFLLRGRGLTIDSLTSRVPFQCDHHYIQHTFQ